MAGSGPRSSCASPRARFARSRRGFASTGSSRRAARSSWRTSTSATGSRRPIRRTRTAASAGAVPEPAARGLFRPTGSQRCRQHDNGERPRVGPWDADWSADEYREAVGERASCDRARRRLPGQPRAASLGAVRGHRRRARGPRSRHCRRCIPIRSSGSGWAIVSASPELFLARRGRRVWTKPIKGTRPLGAAAELRRLGEGRGRARDDRRSRAERSLAGLRAGNGPLARASADTPARGRRAHGLDGRGHAPGRCRRLRRSWRRRSPAGR